MHALPCPFGPRSPHENRAQTTTERCGVTVTVPQETQTQQQNQRPRWRQAETPALINGCQNTERGRYPLLKNASPGRLESHHVPPCRAAPPPLPPANHCSPLRPAKIPAGLSPTQLLLSLTSPTRPSYPPTHADEGLVRALQLLRLPPPPLPAHEDSYMWPQPTQILKGQQFHGHERERC